MPKQKNNYRYASLITAVLLASVLICVSVFYSCGANIFSVEDDVSMGKEIEQEIVADQKQFPLMQGHQDIKDYVSGLGKYVLENSKAMAAMIRATIARGRIIRRVEIPADLRATISYLSPKLPKVIREERRTAKGNAIEVRVMAA